MSKTVWIGIDPDVKKSGVAVWKNNELDLQNLTFFELYETLSLQRDLAFLYEHKLKVIVEAGWKNIKSNWHYNGNNKNVVSRIGAKVGANHETGKKIIEMCEHLGVDYEEYVPHQKKIDAVAFALITGYKKRTNSEQRDAGMLVYGK